MAQYDTSTYGERIADVCDDLYNDIENVDAMAEFLAELRKVYDCTRCSFGMYGRPSWI